MLGVSADIAATLTAFTKENDIHFPLLSDFRRQMLPQYDAMVTDQTSPSFRYAKRAYFILDKQGVVRFVKVEDNPLDLMTADQLLQALKESGAA